MIVRGDDSSLLLITQPDHAALAGRLMAHWSGLARAPHRDLVLLATAEHDNGWREPDAAPLVAGDGRLLDFIHAPDDVRRGVWPRGVQRLASTPYAAALVAQHAIHIFDRYRRNAEWAPFFDEMTRRRNEQLADAGGDEPGLLADYFFVRMGDLLSLVFCNGWREEQTYGEYRIGLADSAILTISPDPFDGREIRFAIKARRLPRRRFASLDDACTAFERAPEALVSGMAVGA